MHWTQFKCPVSQICLAGTEITSWSFTQEVAGSSPFTVMPNILSLNSKNSVKIFKELNCFLDNTASQCEDLPHKLVIIICYISE